MKTSLCNFYILCICLLFCKSTIAQNANTSLSNLVAPVKINVVLQPDKDNKRNLGSFAKAWKNLYIDSALYLEGSKFLSAPGLWSTATGFSALASNVGGINNTANGFLALYRNTSGYVNSAFGSYTLSYNTTGNYNSAFGANSLYLNTSDYNSAFGTNALTYNSTGYNNSAFGSNALNNNTTGYYNSAFGSYALYSNSTAGFNSAFGYYALFSNTSGEINSAFGTNALALNTSGNANSAFGNGAMYSNTQGIWNCAFGDVTLSSNTTGNYNSAFGFEALYANTTGNRNTGCGYQTLFKTTASEFNTAVGYDAGWSYNNGYNNVFIGANTDVNGAGYYNDVAIGQGTICTNVSQVRLGNGATSSIGGYAGWTNISDGRVKKNIRQNVPGLAFINKLQPVTYNLDLEAADKIIQYQRKDTTGRIIPFTQVEQTARSAKEKIVYTGFVAQDVEHAAKSLNYDFSGVDAAKNSKDLYGLRYADFVVPLVKAVQELSKQNDSLKELNASLQSQINEMKSAIQMLANKEGVNLSTVNSQQSTVNAGLSSASLLQNVPNPYTHTTSIAYNLPAQFSSAQIIITDVSGKVLKTIMVSGKGKGVLHLDASSLASGTYNYSLLIDGKIIDTKKMIAAQ